MTRPAAALTMFALLACNAPETKHENGRSILVPGPGPFGYDVAKDGRLAYGAYVDGKSAIFVANADGSNAKRITFGVWDSSPFWSPDGKSIAFARDLGGQSDILVIPADGGTERALGSSPAHEYSNGWLADGSAVIVGRGSAHGVETWIYRVSDGTGTRMFEGEGSTDAYPSPDGKWIAYNLNKNGHFTVWLWDVEKKVRRQLTSDGFEGLALSPFSPDSRSLVFESRRTGTLDLWRIDLASGTKTQVTQDVGDDASARWSPDGTRIAFVSNRGGQPDVWVVGNSDADAVRVTDDGLAETQPRWTVNGDAILAAVPLGHQHIYSIPVNGGESKALTSGDWEVQDATLSRDGKLIAYSGTRNGDGDVWVVPVTGGESHLAGGGPGYDGDASFSPDGSMLAFYSTRSGSSDLWIAPSQGGTARRLTDWPTQEDAPKWSPDGKTIAFRSTRESDEHDYWIMPAEGGKATRLTSVGTVNDDAQWSRDGKWFAFTTQSTHTIQVVSASGGTPKIVFPATSFNPRWSPDGTTIAAPKCEAGYCRVEVRKLDGTLVRRFSEATDVYEFGQHWSGDGSRVFVNFQDLRGDGGTRVMMHPLAAGPGRLITGPAGFTLNLFGVTNGDSAVVAYGGPFGNALQRIPLPAPKK